MPITAHKITNLNRGKEEKFKLKVKMSNGYWKVMKIRAKKTQAPTGNKNREIACDLETIGY